MSRLIDAEALGINKAKREIFNDPKYADGWNSAIEVINNAPTVDAVPLRHGRWLTTDAYPHHLYCSLCYKTYLKNAQWLDTLGVPTNFCPNCGARMEWRRRNETKRF